MRDNSILPVNISHSVLVVSPVLVLPCMITFLVVQPSHYSYDIVTSQSQDVIGYLQSFDMNIV